MTMEHTRLIMKKYAIKLANDVLSKGTPLVNSANYIDLLIDIQHELLEFSSNPSSNLVNSGLRTNSSIRVNYLYQLWAQVHMGVSLNDPDFNHIKEEDIINIVFY